MADEYPNELLKTVYTTRLVTDRDGNSTNPFPSSVTATRGKRLYDMVRQERAARTLEVGLSYGLSAQWIMQAMKDNGNEFRHTAIDPNQNDPAHYRGIGCLNAERSGFRSSFSLMEHESAYALPKLVYGIERAGKFDFIYIDGMHLFDFVMVDFFYCDMLLRPGGLLVFDDLWMASQRKVLSYVLSNRHYELAKEYQSPVSTPSRLKRMARFTAGYPQDMLANNIPVAYDSDDFAVLRKTADDDRIATGNWEQYAAF